MNDRQVALALIPASGQENYVRRRFWRKVRSTLGHVPFADRAIAAYYAAADPSTPAYVKAVLFAALAYFVMPIDLLPDFIVGFGFTDDAAVLMAAFKALSPHVTDEHRQRAAQYLNRA